VLGTSLSTISILDIRTMRSLLTLENPLHLGPITSLCVDHDQLWLVAGTASGNLTLWDLRFGLLLKSWTIGPRKIDKVAIHPSKGNGRWIVVAAAESGEEQEREGGKGTRVAEVWDLEQGSKVEEFRIASPQQQKHRVPPSSTTALSNRTNLGNEEPSSSNSNEATLDPAAAIEALLASSTAPPLKTFPRTSNPSQSTAVPPVVVPSIRAFLLGTDYSLQPTARPSVGNPDSVESRQGKKDGGYLVTGGEDRKLRFWDLGKPTRSAIVSGLDIDEEVPSFRYANSYLT
jgi:phosphoinositide-3-kinase regulatory subunit 4